MFRFAEKERHRNNNKTQISTNFREVSPKNLTDEYVAFTSGKHRKKKQKQLIKRESSTTAEMSTLQWRKNPETTKSRRNLKGCQHSGNIFEAFSTDGEIVVNLKNRLISEQNMNPLLQQKCVFCRDERLPKHKKRQTKPDLLISSVFSKHHPPMNNFKKKTFARFDQFLNKT